MLVMCTTTLVTIDLFLFTSDRTVTFLGLHACLHKDDVSIGLHGAVT